MTMKCHCSITILRDWLKLLEAVQSSGYFGPVENNQKSSGVQISPALPAKSFGRNDVINMRPGTEPIFKMAIANIKFRGIWRQISEVSKFFVT